MSSPESPSFETETTESTVPEADKTLSAVEQFNEDFAKKGEVAAWLVEKSEIHRERNDRIGKEFGSIGIRLVNSLKDPESGLNDKVGAVLGATVDAAGSVAKASLIMSPLVGIAGTVGGKEVANTLDSGVTGFVDTFSDKVVDKKQDGTYGFDASGVAELANVKSLAVTGVEGIANGVGAGVNTSAELAQAELEADPDSESAKARIAVANAYNSAPVGHVVDMATRVASRKIKSSFDKAA